VQKDSSKGGRAAGTKMANASKRIGPEVFTDGGGGRSSVFVKEGEREDEGAERSKKKKHCETEAMVTPPERWMQGGSKKQVRRGKRVSRARKKASWAWVKNTATIEEAAQKQMTPISHVAIKAR